MAKLDNIGNLMYLYLEDIKSSQASNYSLFIVNSTAKLFKDGNTRNWLPLIVKETGEDQYKLIANSFGYQVAKEVNLERVWCIIADDSPETEEIAQILTGEKLPKINLSIASKKEITQAIEYLTTLPKKPLKGVNKSLLIDRLSSAPKKYLQNFNYIPRLNCGIRKGSKLEALKEVFYLTPEPICEDVTDKTILNLLTVSELKKIAKARQLKNFSKLSKAKLVELLTKENRGYKPTPKGVKQKK